MVERRFLPAMTVSHALPRADEGGLAARPAVTVRGAAGRLPRRRLGRVPRDARRRLRRQRRRRPPGSCSPPSSGTRPARIGACRMSSADAPLRGAPPGPGAPGVPDARLAGRRRRRAPGGVPALEPRRPGRGGVAEGVSLVHRHPPVHRPPPGDGGSQGDLHRPLAPGAGRRVGRGRPGGPAGGGRVGVDGLPGGAGEPRAGRAGGLPLATRLRLTVTTRSPRSSASRSRPADSSSAAPRGASSNAARASTPIPARPSGSPGRSSRPARPGTSTA